MPLPPDDPLAQARELEQFFYAALHDLKAPLRSIDNLSLWVQEGLGEGAPPAVAADLKELRQRVQRLAQLLAGLQDYARAGAAPLPAVRVDWSDLTRELLAQAPRRDGIEIRVGAGVPSFSAPHAVLLQILGQLLDNAVRHHDKAAGWVELSAAQEDGGVRLSVRDNGPGIPPEDRERVLRPFQTLKPKDEGGGNGLGLPLVLKALRPYGASLRLDPAPGQGCAASVFWPQAPAA